MITREGDRLIFFAEGRIDTNTAPRFSNELEAALDGVMDLTIDCSRLEYISSSGLRVLMKAIHAMERRRGDIRITEVNENIYEILEVTGFIGACDVERKT